MKIDKCNDKCKKQQAQGLTLEQQNNHSQELDTLKQEFYSVYSKPTPSSILIENFDIIKTLGSGAHGVVFLIRDKNTFRSHAMKAIEKEKTVKDKHVGQVFRERNILQSTKFPFVLSLDFSWKDNVYVYLVLPYEQGGILLYVMQKFRVLSEPLAQFYTAQVVLAIEYLHHCSVIHRDVKPENIFISESGYIKLGDFGYCKVIQDRTWTICGTPEYIAPEIIISEGYSFPIDWWSVGVLLYEMKAGYPPFYHSNVMKLYDKILTGEFKMPSSMTPHCKSLVRNLLQVGPTKRYGALKSGVFDIKSHEWFLDVDWNSLYHQSMKPPFIPLGGTIECCENPEKLLKSEKCLYEDEFENF